MSQRLHLNERELRKAWNTAHVSNFDDWAHWMRTLSLSLLEASPSPAIRACYDFAHVRRPAFQLSSWRYCVCFQS